MIGVLGLLSLVVTVGCVDNSTAYVRQSTAIPVVLPSPTIVAALPPTVTTPTPATASESSEAAAARDAVALSTAVPSKLRDESPPSIRPEALEKMEVERVFPELSFKRMVGMAYAEDGSDRLFVVLQRGVIVSFANEQGVEEADVFLDIEERVSDRGNEEGLLGLAFDPEYSANGYFYVYYSAANPRRSVLSRFTVGGGVADPDSERVILEVEQPHSNHNGGQIAFGPDGYLYVGLGDGGSRGDPQGNGQDLSTLLGSIIRIDVSTLDETGSYAIPADNPFVGVEGARGEIWAYGIRNPWRFSFDRESGELWMADVGQNRFEEVDIVRRGLNYGWNVMEGSSCFKPSRGCDAQGFELPVAEYGRDGGCSVTGGYVYRGDRLPSLYGAYIYGDFCSGKIWGLRYEDGRVTEQLELVDSRLEISSFGEDQSREMFILSFDGGIYRLVAGGR
ncbi:MAG: PQQ-dependent sugar dehydrogenase [Chloroflexi bacterium]|nr:PQQ-dependent sugar dehydrogenase [Chloroflexota bacterium]